MFSASKTAAPASGFFVKNSLRFRSSASAYLSRTATLSAIWTLSVWVKRGALGVTSPIFAGSVLFNSNDTLTAGTLTTTAVYRDPSAWYHIVVSNNGCYVNGVSVGSTATGILVSPRIASNAVNYFDGYLAEISLIDGQSLTASSFGAFNSTTGVWQPARYTGTYGTNGFYLKFSDTTSTTTLCYDYSGNSNNWTPNNISLTAGSTYDSMLDSPTNYDNGGNGVGNYAVLNPLSPPVTAGNATLSNGNLNITGGPSGDAFRCSTITMSSGKWYFETTIITVGAISMVGINNVLLQPGDYYASGSPLGYVYFSINGNKQNNGVSVSYGASYTSGDIIGCAFDADAGSLTFYKNGVSQGVAYSSIPAASYCFNVYGRISGGANNCAANFGQRPFSYTPPTGFKALNTQNLPAASIVNGAGYMAATLWNGDGSASRAISNAVNGVSFQPDFTWIKCRSSAQTHVLQDVIRGATLAATLSSQSTAAEGGISAQDYGAVTAYGSTGFTVGQGSQGGGNAAFVNYSGFTYVGWQWKANGTAVSNNAGSITSQVSANTTAGFSVTTFTCNAGGSGTFGHGLGVAPSMVIIKSRTNGAQSWVVGCSAIAWTNYLLLNQTGASAANSSVWNNTAPSSSVVTLGSGFTNANYGDCVAYCFAAIAGYSAFGSFSGNASTDGVFVYTGFLPRLVMVKCSSGVGNWFMLDSSRNTYNVVNNQLYPNLSNAESAVTTLDILSNGFKMRTSADPNASATYVYAAWAESPFQNSLAR